MKSTRHNLLGLVNSVETQRHFNVDTMSYDVVSMLKRRRVSIGKQLGLIPFYLRN